MIRSKERDRKCKKKKKKKRRIPTPLIESSDTKIEFEKVNLGSLY